jgi:hypothetical protein
MKQPLWGLLTLEHHAGPRKWQADIISKVDKHILENRQDKAMKVLRDATSSGRGIGKSALTSWIAHWMISTRWGSTTILMANSEGQLKSRTMAELRKWVGMSIHSHWFDTSAMSVRPAEWFAEALRKDLGIDNGYYYIEAQLWSEENPDRVAGVHNHHGVCLIFDEASGIPDSIWSVCAGFFTEEIPDRYWFAFSNPRRNSGQFFECFHRDAAFWNTRFIDSRDVEGTDLEVYQGIINQYGEESDEAKVEVKGQFPATGSRQFISREIVLEAMQRHPERDSGAPIVVGVDVARYGEDRSVISTRIGRDCKTIKPLIFKGMNTMELANRVAQHIRRYSPDAVMVDGNGVGGGVVDRLKQMGFRVFEVNAGAAPYDKKRFKNKRAELWSRGKDWLINGGCLEYDEGLISEITAPEYSTDKDAQGRLLIESKEDLKKRGYDSPDIWDSITLTFSEEVPRKDFSQLHHRRNRQQANMKYNELG